ncbi:hypothetical protein GQ44DRAFT_766291 [Phaeosphaeriaceae sp. PMI808]|nr:hypothetical protein GQ44DRAFT_766291 [Phaeosphaeriaceae sp. PMI808]
MTTENLYVILRTIVDLKGPAEPTFSIALPAAFTNLKAAKDLAKNLLVGEGYEPDFFRRYEVNDGSKEWKHGDGVIVYGEGSSDDILKVEIQTVPDTIGLEIDSTGRVKAHLFHVLTTIIDYNNDRSGSQRYSIVEGSHTRNELAKKHALRVLLDGSVAKEDFVEYDEYSGDVEGPFGANVIVHAVKENGQNILVSVISDRTQ